MKLLWPTFLSCLLILKIRLQEQEKKKALLDVVAGETQLWSKRELIEKFIQENFRHISDSDDIPEEFEAYWDGERKLALKKLSQEEKLDDQKLDEVIGDYLFAEKKPVRDGVIGLLYNKPGLKERVMVAERVTNKNTGFVEILITGIAG